jgi:hypothetical protein
LGCLSVKGFSLVPKPAAKIIAFMAECKIQKNICGTKDAFN